MTLKSVAELRRHAHQLAEAFEVRLVEVPDANWKPEYAAAEATSRVVVAHPIIDETTYAVVLHEIGHLAAPWGVLQRDHANRNLTRVEEAAAWEWARHYALEWTAVMEQVATWAEQTYQDPAPAPPPRRIPWDLYPE